MKEPDFRSVLEEGENLVDSLRILCDELDHAFEAGEEAISGLEFALTSAAEQLDHSESPLAQVMLLVGDYMRGDRDWAEVEEALRGIEDGSGHQGEFLPR